MADQVDKLLANLLERATHEGTPEEEARTSAVAFLRIAKKHGRRVVALEGVAAPPPAPPRVHVPPQSAGVTSRMPEWMKDALRAAGEEAIRDLQRGLVDDLLEAVQRGRRARPKKKR